MSQTVGRGGKGDAPQGLKALSAAKRRELEAAVVIVREEFARAVSRRTQERF